MELYTKLEQRDHVLLRPDTYIGSKSTLNRDDYICENKQISSTTINGNTGLERLFIEVLTNAIDNVWNSESKNVKCSYIKVTIKKDGTTVIKNDGLTIPITMSPKYKVYNPELIFGHLLTSSNYDDSKTRVTAGRNGLGGKLANIFSTLFEVKTSDGTKTYQQRWTNNMKDKTEPVITETKDEIYTRITYKPDFKYFGLENYTPDIIKLFRKYCYDCAMVTKVPVYVNLNDSKVYKSLKIPDLQAYAKLYETIKEEEILTFQSKDSEVVLIPSLNGFKHITFVNGAFTNEGGRHLDNWSEGLFRPIVDKLNEKYDKKVNKKPTKSSKSTKAEKSSKVKEKSEKKIIKLTIKDIKDYFMIFINSTVDKPTFNAQTKNKLESPNVTVKIPKSYLTKVLKWEFVSVIDQKVNLKLLDTLNKGRKKIKLDKKVTDANFAGKKAQECTLIICEGDSAKTYVISGIGALNQQDYIGVYPITGKLLNCRNATNTQKIKNTVITGIQQILNLEYGVDYNDEKNFSRLRYSKVMIVADADEDGKHITGLILNFFDALFPSLLKRPNFLYGMKTPIQGIKNIFFYSKEEAKCYMLANGITNAKMDYYKGLGSLGDSLVDSTFHKRLIRFVIDDNYLKSMEKAFDKKFADIRKGWIAAYKPIEIVDEKFDFKNVNSREENISITNYIDTEVITHAVANCERTLPHLLDGFKEVQRKIFYTLYTSATRKGRTKSNKFLKLVQIGGEINKKVIYHHGEGSLYESIVGMAQSFVGSNNISLLSEEKGQFGSRISGGEDYGQPRYLATKLNKIAFFIFREEDMPLYTNRQEDGIEIECQYFLPIIPFILVNGSSGIGTGWNTNIPSCNPLDLVDYIKEWLDTSDEKKGITELKTVIHPYFKKFNGKVLLLNGKYYSKGLLEQVNEKTYKVTELPIGCWTENFKERLDDLKEKDIIKSYKNKCTKELVNFEIKFVNEVEIKQVKVYLKLKTLIKTSNMVMFDTDFTIKKFQKLEDIIRTYCTVRLDAYKRRKEYQLTQLKEALKYTNNKFRFISEIIEEKLIIKKLPKSEVEKKLTERKYDKKENKYDYLLHMRIDSFTEEKLQDLKKAIEKTISEIDVLTNTDIKDIWKKELDEFIVEYEKL